MQSPSHRPLMPARAAMRVWSSTSPHTSCSPSARLSTLSTCSSSGPTSPKTCNFAGAGVGKPQIGLAARPASRSYEGRCRRHTAAEASPVFANSRAALDFSTLSPCMGRTGGIPSLTSMAARWRRSRLASEPSRTECRFPCDSTAAPVTRRAAAFAWKGQPSKPNRVSGRCARDCFDPSARRFS